MVGGRVARRTDGRGRIRWIAGPAARVAPGTPVVPRLSAADAVARAAAWAARRPPGTPAPSPGPGSGAGRRSARTRPHLVWWAPPTPGPAPSRPAAARLAWQIDLPLTRGPRAALAAPRLTIDADTGRILQVDDRLWTAAPQADVFEVSPAVTPTLSRVSLDRIAPGAPSLASPDLEVFNCPDTGACRQVVPSTDYHACDIVALAAPDPGGNFIYPFEGDTAPADRLAEVMAFYQADKGLAVLRGLGAGLGALADPPLRVVVNFTVADTSPRSLDDCKDGHYDGDQVLMPLDNAFFTDSDEGLGPDYPGPSLVFGQGNAVDFALDGDVVQHELGHAITATLVPDMVSAYVDRYGTNLSPAAVNEAYADMVALMVSDDPRIGEYVGTGLGGGTPRRDLSVFARCPEDVTGEAHHDSLVLSSALFQARTALAAGDPARRRAFDRSVVVTWSALDAFADYQQAASLTAGEIEVELGAAAAARARAIFTAHGLDGCGGRVIDGAAGVALATLPSVADPTVGGDAPAPFQLRVEVDWPAAALTFDVALYDSYAIDPAQRAADVLVKPGAEPILWYLGPDGQLRSDASQTVAVELVGDRHGQALVPGPLAPGIYHLMLDNHGGPAILHDTRVGQIALADDGGCGCRVGRRAGDAGTDLAVDSTAPLAGLALALLLAGRLRRRRFGRTGPRARPAARG